MTRSRPHVVVVDPAVSIAEVESFNLITQMASVPCTYHLPAMFGMRSLATEDMTSAVGIVVFGSAASVHDRTPWQIELEDWLRPYLERRIPTIGFCYGHQMLAHMLGGRVDYVFPDKHKHSGFREIEVDSLPWLGTSRGSVVVSHCETVVEAPKSMRVIARSPEISIDGLAHTDLPVWSFQSHPESTSGFLANHDIVVADAAHALSYGHGMVRGFLEYAAKTRR